MPTKASRHNTWWRISGHVVACSGDGARNNRRKGPFRGLLQVCRQLCTLHHGSVPGIQLETHFKKAYVCQRLGKQYPGFSSRSARTIRSTSSRQQKDQRILSQAQPQAAHLLALILSAKKAQ